MTASATPRVALVHDWLLGMRGGEKVLEEACRLFPEAEIYTLLHRPGAVSPTIESHAIRTSWLQKLPGVHRYHRYTLPLMPRAIESMRLCDHDLVVSFSHCVALGVEAHDAPHLSYCFTPMRYLYDQYEDYFGAGRSGMGALTRGAMRAVRPYLRRWDLAAAARVDAFVADSSIVRERIRSIYGREAQVVYPPVDTQFYAPDPSVERQGFALIVSALAPYKRVDVAIDACRAGGFPLRIAGSGPEEARLRQRAEGADVRFLGWRSDEEIRDLYRQAAVFLYPQVEDFGITAVEAQACGTPVVAFGRGGGLETVVHERTGLHFEPQSGEALAEAVAVARERRWDRAAIRAQAERFSRAVFRRQLQAAIAPLLGAPAPG